MLRKTLPYILSIPHYVSELKRPRSVIDFYNWFYFKLPYIFPLASFPPYITIELTTACNFNCRHCWRPYSLQKRGVGSITDSMYEKIIMEISTSAHFCQVLKIGGAGEPALHPHFHEFMIHLNVLERRKINAILYTNGTLFDRFRSEEIMNWNISTIVVSVDGIDQKSYEQIRTGGNYCRLLKQLKEFVNYRKNRSLSYPLIEIRHVIMPSETIGQLLCFLRQWGIIGDTVKYQSLIPLGSNINIDSNIPISAKTMARGVRRELPIEWTGNVPVKGCKYQFVGNIEAHSIEELWRRMTSTAKI